MIRIAQVGYGYWGPNLFRNFLLTKGCKIVTVCDADVKKLQEIKKLHPTIHLTTKYEEILTDSSVDAVVLTTPPSSHFDLAQKALFAGKDVLVEKPMTTNISDGEKLVDLAKRKERILMVDHTFIYAKPIEKIREIVKSGKMGKIVAIDSVRINLGLYQRDSNVVEDLAIHDFAILDYLFDGLPKSITVIAARHFDSQQEDQAYLHLWYPNNILAHVNVSWFSPIKERRMIVCGTEQMLVYDEMELTEKIKIFNTGIKIQRDPREILKMKVGYRQGDIYSPNIEATEPLFAVAQDFITAIRTRKTPRCNGSVGLRVVKVLEAAIRSLKEDGKTILIA